LEVEGSSTISGNVVLNDGAAMSVSGTAALDGGLSLKSGATAASLEGVSFLFGQVSGNGESARMQDVWMEAVGEAYGFSGVAMENVHFSAALATLTLANVSFDTDCSFSVGAEGSIILSDATLRITLPEAGNGGIYRVDLSHLFQCTVEGDLSFDVDTEALVAAGYTGVELDFGRDADEDYSNLTLSMDGATYEGTEGNVAGFTLPTIPEPSTATLSLLALAALVSRRRRG
ncbi:MAG: PEP-CTERM sorting domain-containing protein, partial [Akkermansia sp.]|nr:PEP-CTERM sorting domain-containing protein [Akkermansia sp.]